MDDSDSRSVDDELATLEEKKRRLEEITSELERLGNTHSRVRRDIQDGTKRRPPTKQEILDFCDKILAKWEGDPTKDGRYAFAMNAVKTSIVWTEEETVQEIWSEIISWVFEIYGDLPPEDADGGEKAG